MLGVLLVLTAVVVGARVVAAADDTERVWVATRELAAGTTLTADDVTTRAVRLDSTARAYLGAQGAAPDGYLLTRPVGAGELIPAAAVAAPDRGAARRQVTVPVERFHYPGDLARGARVDVYVTPAASAGAAAAGAPGWPEPRLVLEAAVVADVERESGRLGPTGSGVGVVLSVAPAEVADLVAAIQAGTVDLVRVPADG
jgi:Flp pilus assembly protein CpaB